MNISDQRVWQVFKEHFSSLLEKQNIVQQDLAKALMCSPGHITHMKQGTALPDVIELARIAEYTGTSVDYLLGRVAEKQVEPTKPIRVLENQLEADDDIKEFIIKNTPKEIYFIQYSSVNVSNILKLFRDKPCKIYLLIKHPGIGVAQNRNGDNIVQYQQDKIATQLATLLNVDRPHYEDLHIRCYLFPGAMRAVYVGSPPGEKLKTLNPNPTIVRSEGEVGLLSLSLYRYTSGVAGVVGEENPLIHAYSNTREGTMLYHLFEETFVDLWNNGVPAADVLDSIATTRNQ